MPAPRLIPEQRLVRARVVANIRRSWVVEAAAARAGHLSRFVRQGRSGRHAAHRRANRRAERALKAHLLRMCLASSKARQERTLRPRLAANTRWAKACKADRTA